MFKNMIAGLVEKLANQFTGRLVTKAVTALAVWLLAHKAMTPAQQGPWIAANADWIQGCLLGLISMGLSIWQHGKTEEAKQVAAYSPAPAEPPTPAVAAKVEAAAQVLAGGGIGAGNVQIGTTNQTKGDQ